MARIIGIPRNEFLAGYEPDPDIGADILHQMEHHEELKQVAAKLQERILVLREKFQRLNMGRLGFFAQRELAFTAIALAQFEELSRHATEAIAFNLREATQTTQSVLDKGVISMYVCTRLTHSATSKYVLLVQTSPLTGTGRVP